MLVHPNMAVTTPGRASLAVPSTQNSAPVIEFRCLYTHDVRRKSKRWQDGFLRFHTFNKRVMVYDLLGNLVGDCHWRGTGELAEGEDLELESGEALVQVGEQTARTEQDLASLFEKRKVGPAEERSQPSTQVRTPLRGASQALNRTPLASQNGLLTRGIGRGASTAASASRGSPSAVWSRVQQSTPAARTLLSGSKNGGERPLKRTKVHHDLVSTPAANVSVVNALQRGAVAHGRREARRQEHGPTAAEVIEISDGEASTANGVHQNRRRGWRKSPEQQGSRAGPASRPSAPVSKATKDTASNTRSIFTDKPSSEANKESISKEQRPLGKPLCRVQARSRRKLLCKDTELAAQDVTPPGRQSTHRSRLRSQSPRLDELSKFSEAQADRLRARLNRPRRGVDSAEVSGPNEATDEDDDAGGNLERDAGRRITDPKTAEAAYRGVRANPPGGSVLDHPRDAASIPVLPAAAAKSAPPNEGAPRQRAAFPRQGSSRGHLAPQTPTTNGPETRREREREQGNAEETSDIGPWSDEARDLFDWRPPGR